MVDESKFTTEERSFLRDLKTRFETDGAMNRVEQDIYETLAVEFEGVGNTTKRKLKDVIYDTLEGYIAQENSYLTQNHALVAKIPARVTDLPAAEQQQVAQWQKETEETYRKVDDLRAALGQVIETDPVTQETRLQPFLKQLIEDSPLPPGDAPQHGLPGAARPDSSKTR